MFDAWLDPEIAGLWLFATATQPMAHGAIDARVGGSFRLVGRRGIDVEHAGRYLEIARPRRLVFSLSLEQQPDIATRLRVDILPRKGGCHLTLTHEGVARRCSSAIEARWAGILYGLEVTLQSGSGRKRADRGRVGGASPLSVLPRPESTSADTALQPWAPIPRRVLDDQRGGLSLPLPTSNRQHCDTIQG